MFSNPEEAFGGTRNMLTLIDLIYSAVDDTSLWPVALDQIAEVMHGGETLLWTSFTDSKATNILSVARMNRADLDPYVEYYGTVNVLANRCDEICRDGEVRYSHRAVPDVEFESTEFYNDYFKPHSMHYSLGLKIPLSNQTPPYFACMRPKSKGPFEQREGIVLDTLMPHLQRALNLHLRLTQMRSNVEGLETALDAFDHAVFGLNCEGKVVLSNRQAERLVLLGDGIKLVRGRLSATRSEENLCFQSIIAGAIATGTGAGICAESSLLLTRRMGVPLRLTVTPCASGFPVGYGQAVALIFVSDPARVPLSRAAILKNLYKLSPTEGRLADLLAGGKEVSEAATHLGITLETARFHVKRVLSKTNTRRQAELVRLIGSLPGL